MPVFFQYLIKLSISLGIIYLFYQLALRRLTFYNHNRWYLFGYSALCFVIALVNIEPILENADEPVYGFIRMIPAVDSLTLQTTTDAMAESDNWSVWTWASLLLISGSAILIMRMIFQLVSFRRLMRQARLINDDGIKFYQVNADVMPFSFGRSIFINQHLHTESELKEIVRHEFVHVKQCHTADIIWGEVLCILNWFNPFAWLIRNAIRQNLEFIADSKVISNGIDKKQYQLLLLRVTGNGKFNIGTSFSFSSIKKRIVMMNKIRSARIHLIKFLFVVPLLAILLLAFRNKLSGAGDNKTQYVAGIVVDAGTGDFLKNVRVTETISGLVTSTDEYGYFRFDVPEQSQSGPVTRFDRDGYSLEPVINEIPINRIGSEPTADLKLVYLSQVGSGLRSSVISKDYDGEPNYALVKKLFLSSLKNNNPFELVNDLVEQSNKPIIFIDGLPNAISSDNRGRAWLSKGEMKESPEFKVWVDGTIMTMEEANATIERARVLGVGAAPRAYAKKVFGIDQNLLLLNLVKKKGNWALPDTIPSKSIVNDVETPSALHRDDTMGPEHKKFFDRNREINLLYWKRDGSIEVYRKSGDVEKYTNPSELEKFVKKYGPVPTKKGSSKVKAVSPDANAVATVKNNNLLWSAGSQKPLVIVDGTEWPSELDINLINGASIESLNIFKGETATKLYGDKAKDGVIAIVTKKTKVSTTSNQLILQPVYYINGKKVTKQTVDLIDPSSIQSIDVLKGSKAIEKYGDDGKNGVIEITVPVV